MAQPGSTHRLSGAGMSRLRRLRTAPAGLRRLRCEYEELLSEIDAIAEDTLRRFGEGRTLRASLNSGLAASLHRDMVESARDTAREQLSAGWQTLRARMLCEDLEEPPR